MDPVTTKFLVSTGVQVLGHMFGKKKRDRELKAANAEKAKMEKQYRNLDFSNPYENLSNPYKDMQNPMEDLTVNLKQAQFMKEQQAQRDVNVLDSLQGVAGSSGVAGLAQTVYNQGVKADQAAAASIGLQESANQKAATMAQTNINQAMAQQEAANQANRAKGAFKSMELEKDRTETLYGMSLQRAAAAEKAKNDATKNLIGGVGKAFTGYAGTATGAGNLDRLFSGKGKYSWQGDDKIIQ